MTPVQHSRSHRKFAPPKRPFGLISLVTEHPSVAAAPLLCAIGCGFVMDGVDTRRPASYRYRFGGGCMVDAICVLQEAPRDVYSQRSVSHNFALSFRPGPAHHPASSTRRLNGHRGPCAAASSLHTGADSLSRKSFLGNRPGTASSTSASLRDRSSATNRGLGDGLLSATSAAARSQPWHARTTDQRRPER